MRYILLNGGYCKRRRRFSAPEPRFVRQNGAVMQRWSPDPERWYILPVRPGMQASCHRWNAVIISILAVLVLGLLFASAISQAPDSTAHKVVSKIHHV